MEVTRRQADRLSRPRTETTRIDFPLAAPLLRHNGTSNSVLRSPEMQAQSISRGNEGTSFSPGDSSLICHARVTFEALMPFSCQTEDVLGSLAQDETRPMQRADFARVGACGVALLLHSLFLVSVGCLEVVTTCVRVRLGLALLVGLGELGQGTLCLTLCCLQTPLHRAGRAHRLALWLGSGLLCLTAIYVVCFFALLLGGASLQACGSAVQLLLGSPTITCLVVGVPATFLPLVIVWSHSKGPVAEGSTVQHTMSTAQTEA